MITNIKPTDTPVYTKLGRTKVVAKRHEWSKDTLATRALNKAVENQTLTDGTSVARTTDYNYTQIITKKWGVTGTQEAVAKAGFGQDGLASEWEYQSMKALKELKNDIEWALINGTLASGASGTASEMAGIVAKLTTNIETGTGTGTETLTETMFNNSLQTIYTAGGLADWTLANAFQKRKISGFDAFSKQTTNIDASEKKVSAIVTYYESDFGVVKVELSRDVPTNTVLNLQSDMFKVGILRPIENPDLAKSTDGEVGAFITELTLVALNEASSGKITQLATA